MIAVQDEGTKFLSPAVDAIKGVGGVDPVMIEYRGSFALVGYADAATYRPVWIAQQVRGRAQGPSVISSRIPLSPSRRKDKVNLKILCLGLARLLFKQSKVKLVLVK